MLTLKQLVVAGILTAMTFAPSSLGFAKDYEGIESCRSARDQRIAECRKEVQPINYCESIADWDYTFCIYECGKNDSKK